MTHAQTGVVLWNKQVGEKAMRLSTLRARAALVISLILPGCLTSGNDIVYTPDVVVVPVEREAFMAVAVGEQASVPFEVTFIAALGGMYKYPYEGKDAFVQFLRIPGHSEGYILAHIVDETNNPSVRGVTYYYARLTEERLSVWNIEEDLVHLSEDASPGGGNDEYQRFVLDETLRKQVWSLLEPYAPELAEPNGRIDNMRRLNSYMLAWTLSGGPAREAATLIFDFSPG